MAEFALVYTKRAVADIGKLDSLSRKRLGVKILELRKDPAGKSRKLINNKIGTYRYRIGDYRVVFDLAGMKVVVLRVGHRKGICR